MSSFSFSVQTAEELGVRAAVILNIFYNTPCEAFSFGYIASCVGSFMSDKEIEDSLNKLKKAKKIKGTSRFSLCQNEVTE